MPPGATALRTSARHWGTHHRAPPYPLTKHTQKCRADALPPVPSPPGAADQRPAACAGERCAARNPHIGPEFTAPWLLIRLHSDVTVTRIGCVSFTRQCRDTACRRYSISGWSETPADDIESSIFDSARVCSSLGNSISDQPGCGPYAKAPWYGTAFLLPAVSRFWLTVQTSCHRTSDRRAPHRSRHIKKAGSERLVVLENATTTSALVDSLLSLA